MPLSSLRPALACLVACSACEAGHAAEWSMQPSIWWYLDYDTNRRLVPAEYQGEPANAAGYMTVDLLLRRLTGTDEFDIHPQIEFQRFTKDTELNADNGSLQLTAAHHGQLWSITGDAGYAQNSTLVSEIASTGIIDTNTRQNALTADVSATRELSARQRFTGELSYADITYPGGLPAGLVGYIYPSASLSYAYDYSLATTWSLIVSGAQMQPEYNLPVQDTGSLSLQVTHSFTSLLTLTAAAGASEVHTANSHDSGLVWKITLVRRTDHEGKWSLSFREDYEPNGSGQLMRHEQADIALTRVVAPHLFMILSATGVRNSDAIAPGAVDVRNYFAGDAGLDWQVARHWWVSFTGGYSQATEPALEQFAHGWRGAVKLRWAPQARSVSR